MEYTNLIAAILNSFALYGADLVKSITDLAHGSPRETGEPDTAWVSRLNALAKTKIADTTATDAAVTSDPT
jgi:hypothetical protein